MASISVSGTGFAAPTRGWAASALAPLSLAASAFALLIGASPASTLDVGIDNLRSIKGLVRICLTRDPDNFPDCTDDAHAITRSIPADAPATAFPGLSPGDYAIAVIHDENANAKLDTFAGIPKEGIGFSRNPKFTFGPPRFAAARFAMDGEAKAQQVRIRYFL
jgi:uncharacterized protein (DUF2141 family)